MLLFSATRCLEGDKRSEVAGVAALTLARSDASCFREPRKGENVHVNTAVLAWQGTKSERKRKHFEDQIATKLS